MDIDKFGIVLTIVVVVGVLGIGSITSGEFGMDIDLLQVEETISPEVAESEERLDNAYYNWCYTMKIECQ